MTICCLCKEPKRPECENGFFTTSPGGIEYVYACNNLSRRAFERDQENDWKTPKRFVPTTASYKKPKTQKFEARPNQIVLAELLTAAAASGKPFRSFLISGPHGSGKSHLAVGFLQTARSHGASGIFASANQFITKMKSTFGNRDDGRDEESVIGELIDPDVLILDDFGKGTGSDWEAQAFFQVIDSRYKDNKATILTTNMSPEQIKETDKGAAIFSRLSEDNGYIEIQGSND